MFNSNPLLQYSLILDNQFFLTLQMSTLFLIIRFAEDPWLWELDWSVQDVRTKKLKPPKKKKKSKLKENTVESEDLSTAGTSTTFGETTSDLLAEDEMIDDNNVEVVEGLKSSSNILATIPSAADVMYKRRQNLPGYPK